LVANYLSRHLGRRDGRVGRKAEAGEGREGKAEKGRQRREGREGKGEKGRFFSN
jgi:hypothetical protein